MKQLLYLATALFAVTTSFAQQFEWHQVQRPGNTVDYVHQSNVGIINSQKELLCDDHMWKSSDQGITWEYQEKNRYGKTYKLRGIDFKATFLNGHFYAIDSAGIIKYDKSLMAWTRKYQDRIAPYNPSNWYLFGSFACASSGELFALIPGQKLLHSTDDGNTWDSVGNTPITPGSAPPITFNDVTIESIDHMGRIFVHSFFKNYNSPGNSDTLYVTADRGKKWEVVYTGSRGDIYSFAHLHSGETYVITKDKEWWLLKSDKDGRNWRTQTKLSQPHIPQITATINGTLMLTFLDGIYRSVDSGLTWQPLSNPSETVSLRGVPAVDSLDYLYAIGTSNVLNYTDRGIYISKDEGNTWKRSAIPHYSIQNIFKDQIRNRIIVGVGTPYMYHYTVDYSLTGMSLYDSLRVDIPIFSNTIGSKFDTQVYHLAYQPIIDRMISFSYIRRLDTNSSYRSEVLISDDGGQTWEYRMPPLLESGVYISYLFITRNGFIYAGTAGYPGYSGDYIYRSTDNGYSWDQLISGITNPNIYSIAESPSGFMFVGSQSAIYRTNESYFIKLKPNLLNTNVTCFAFDSLKGIYAGTDKQGVIYSNDNGVNWKPLRDGLPLDTAVSALMVTPTGLVLAATHNGLYVLTSGDTVWREESMGINDRKLLSLGMYDDDTYLVGTLHSGLYINKPFPSPKLFSSVKLPPSVRVEGAAMSVNYPNPFADETTIRYEVAEPEWVTIEVYSLLGERVAILENSQHLPGTYETSFAAKHIPSGTYICHLKIGTRSEARRMIKR